MNALKLLRKSRVILVLGAAGAATAMVGCSSDDVTSSPAQGGSSGEAGEASGGKGSAGTASGGDGTAGAVDVGGGAGAEEPAEGGTAGAPVFLGGNSGAAGAAGTPAVEEPPFDLHLSPDATVSTFAITTGGHDRFYGVTYDAAGSIYAVGVTSNSTVAATADYSAVVAKFSATGVLDTTFGTNGYAIRNVAVGLAGELMRGIVVQSSGKIVISGSIEHVSAGADVRDRDLALLRFNANGTKDTTFGDDGIVTLNLSVGVAIAATATTNAAYLADSAWGLDMYPDDRLVISGGMVAASGTDTDFAVVRLSKDGVKDATFGTAGVFTLDTKINGVSNNASPRNVSILPGTQGIIGGGYQPVPGFDTKPCLFKISDAGKLDTTFGVAGVFSESVFEEQTETYSAVPQSDGKLVTAGYARQLSTETTDLLSLRLNKDGTRDLTYGTNGSVKIDIGGFADNARRILVLPNDHIVMVGGGRNVADNVDGVVVALTPDGKPETTFSATGWKTFDLGGPADFIWSLALNPAKTRIAMVGIKGGGSAVGALDDDAALLVMKLVP